MFEINSKVLVLVGSVDEVFNLKSVFMSSSGVMKAVVESKTGRLVLVDYSNLSSKKKTVKHHCVYVVISGKGEIEVSSQRPMSPTIEFTAELWEEVDVKDI